MHSILDYLQDRVLVIDGAMGTEIQRASLSLDDFGGLENCSEILLETRPDFVRRVHDAYLDAGARAVETNTFGANRVVLAEFGIAEKTFDLNRLGAELARERCDAWAKQTGTPRFVLGSVGPGTKLPTLGHTSFDVLEDSYREQVEGLLAGGIDAVLIETCQDLLQAKAAIAGANLAFDRRGRRVPIFCSVTVESTGSLLLGSDISAALAALEPYDEVAVLGLNCATGPQEMSEHVSYLAHRSPKLLSVIPNAGLPQLVDGRTHYPLSPADLARWLLRFVEEDGANIVGGCCGTRAEHIRAVAGAVGERPPKRRDPRFVPSVASLYGAQTLAQDSSYFIIGERTNSNGSRQFRKLLEEEDWDGLVVMARGEEREGCHAIDVCVAHVDRQDEAKDMVELVGRCVTQVRVPIVIDSTETRVLERAYKLIGGRAVCNSINLEDGEEKLEERVKLSKRFGAALIALTIDERGMAKDAVRKVEVARRIHDICVKQHGLRPWDLIFDPLTFTIATGNEDDRRLGIETLEGLRRIKAELPGVFTVLGLSNISFGLKPAARHVLNSVFLHHAREAGLDAAIVHASKITPLFKVDAERRQAAEDLIFDRRREGYDPLHAFIGLFTEAEADAAGVRAAAPRTVEEKLKQRIIDGEKLGIEADLDAARAKYTPLEIINDILLDGMKVVGDLFGAGQMQLPFVLQSAETMKAAVAYLETFMERVEGASKGKVVLATVKGDVHDIGKNLVDIILTNNGYTVYNLGIKQPITTILEACRKHSAQAIGLSGLLVKSTVVMRENLEELERQMESVPVILGGAALSRRYVEVDCRRAYGGRVEYARDAFEGLRLMESVVAGEAERASRYPGARGFAPEGAAAPVETESVEAAQPEAVGAAVATSAAAGSVTQGGAQAPRLPRRLDRPVVEEEPGVPAASSVRRDVAVPRPPFFGSRVVESVWLDAVLPYLNESFLFKFQWQFRQGDMPRAEYERFVDREVRPVYRELVARVRKLGVLKPRAVYGFYPCQSDGDDVILYAPDASRVLHRFRFPRQRKGKGLCIADFFRSVSSGEMDVIGISVVTVGQEVSDTERRWFEENRYRDYLYLHGLGVECAEALAELIHKQMRAELGIGGDDARDIGALFKQGYRGSRYSFGYPACPRLEDQVPLLEVLGAGRIGVTITEEFQLEPEQSTSAIVVHHPQAKYFSVY
jgi:5-methyltetrahydrofolate--homocysteine methyltransferase